MVIDAEVLKKEIKERLQKHEKNEIQISGEKYDLFIPKGEKYYLVVNERINLFEGFFHAEATTKEELSRLIKYVAPPNGYVGRIGIMIYRNEDLIIKDYRAKKQIRKTIAKINDPFLKKLKLALENPTRENISALFSRSDVIEEFYILYKKCKEFLLKNITGISESEKREEFVDNFMVQMLTLWYLQEKNFFNKDKNFFITKFKGLKQKKLKGGFNNYHEFLRYFFGKISGYSDEPFVIDSEIGSCVVIGPAVFLNGEDDPAINIPNKCFYQDGVTEKLINLTPKGRRKKISENDINFDVPLFNLFESRDWVDGDIDEYVLGSLYEKLMTEDKRKKTGSYYTPEEITTYMSRSTIESYLVDCMNERFGKNYKMIAELIDGATREELNELFELLQQMKILDPAVGSAHFLESAMNVLVDIYRKIRDKAREMGIKKMEILVANDEGKIEPFNLLEIPEKEGLFEIHVKFFIILSRNIYGVDINSSALKIAKARLFLTLARHYNVNSNVFIRFPNVHFNIREGNSLIGYVKMGKEKKIGQLQLDLFLNEEQAAYITEKIKLVEELRPYLARTAKTLNLGGNIIKEVEDLNKILANGEIDLNDFVKVLKIKEKLITILIASLNTKHAKPLHDLLRLITELFNQKLDEKFAEDDEIDLDKLKLIQSIPWERKMFHWIFEFPDVFLENKGFDVVIGNPPYGRIKQIIENSDEKYFISGIYSKLYDYQIGNLNLYKLFLERSCDLLRKKGHLSMIFPSSFLGENDSKKLRRFFFEQCTAYKILEFPEKTRIFEGNTQAVTILFYCKNIKDDYEVKIKTNISKEEKNNLSNLEFLLVKRSELKELTGKDYRIPLFHEPIIEWEILKHISKFPPFKGDAKTSPIGETREGHLHETSDKEFKSNEPGDDLLIKGIHLDRYFVNLDPNGPKPRWIINKERFFEKKPEARKNTNVDKIIGRSTINRASKPRLRFAPLKSGFVVTNNVKFIILKNWIDPNYLICILNSTLLNWRFELFSFQNRVNNYEIEDLPIRRIPLSEQKSFIILAKYMLFLKQYYNYFARNDRHLQDIIDYFDNLIDGLVHELYLGEVVKIPIRQLIEDKLIDINLPDNILETSVEERKKILEIISQIHERLENDEKLNKNLRVMNHHSWIKAIYSSFE